MDEYFQAAGALPAEISGPLLRLPPERAGAVQEIRLRCGGPVTFTVAGRQQAAAAYAKELRALQNFVPDRAWMQALLVHLSGCSLHSHEEELRQGFLTIAGGHRVGVAGEYAARRLPGGELCWQPVAVSSVDLRIARCCQMAIPEALLNLWQQGSGGVVLVGEPASGKTTLLRAFATFLGRKGVGCVILDERRELVPPDASVPAGCDVLAGVAKATAAEMALRTLAPQVILLDELGDIREAAALARALNGGVRFVCTLHAASAKQAMRRPQLKLLLQSGLVDGLCLLSGREQPGCVQEVVVL